MQYAAHHGLEHGARGGRMCRRLPQGYREEPTVPGINYVGSRITGLARVQVLKLFELRACVGGCVGFLACLAKNCVHGAAP